MQMLYGLGVRKLAVPGVPAIGCCPKTQRCIHPLGLSYAYFDFCGAWVSLFQNETYGILYME
ncbi:hypothetical protein Hanom_Chr11g00991831 [Helianthus anomalus]